MRKKKKRRSTPRECVWRGPISKRWKLKNPPRHEEEEEDLSTRDRIGRKLQKDRLKRQGTYERAVAQTVANDLALMQREISSRAPTTAEEEAKAWVASGKVKYLLFRLASSTRSTDRGVDCNDMIVAVNSLSNESSTC